MTVYIDLQVCSKVENVDLDFLFHKTGKKHKIGDYSKTGIQLDYSQWNFSFNKMETHEVEIVAKDFYRSIEGIKKQFIEYIHKTKSEVMIYFVIQNYDNDYMHLGLSKESISLFAELSASIDYDGV